ncbi:ABC transporter ATP-binding protein [Acidianus sp. HS-5]|uniref:ATP-binding cassette domain-containing protein n=1 Tax=Acidianus sp. HS-5 TaxID=2886040 RepID=UPI001F3F2C1C|nr:ABC transporter ATP-binding protein [Acidianus sp. HS-5]BDC18271.1 heme ABC transporter [Acidianus sp. HS-5]
MLGLYDVSSGYGKKVVLQDVSFEIKENGVYIVLGRNGAGKTTLLRTIAGILKPMKGKIMKEGSFAYLSHSLALPNEMRVKEALEFFSSILGGDVNNVIEKFDLKGLLDKRIADLSQGQKKRVSIAKIFLKNYDIYLFDEPTENLDPITASKIREEIVSLSKSKIVIYTSHNLYEARDIGKYVIVIDEGKLKFFKPISEIRLKEYKIGIRASQDLSRILNGEYQGEYFVITVDDPSKVNQIVQELISKNIQIYEIKEMKNPLEDLLK